MIHPLYIFHAIEREPFQNSLHTPVRGEGAGILNRVIITTVVVRSAGHLDLKLEMLRDSAYIAEPYCGMIPIIEFIFR
jgi:hypothetical protein